MFAGSEIISCNVIWHDFDVDVFWKEFGDKKCKWDQRSCHLYEGDRDADLAFDTHDTLYTVHTVHCTHGYTVHILRTAFKKSVVCTTRKMNTTNTFLASLQDYAIKRATRFYSVSPNAQM